jgi:hypothetical protein
MPRQKTAAGAFGLSAEDTARLDSWLIEIADKHLGPIHQEANGAWRFGDSHALLLHRNGCWHDFRTGDSGHGALSLLVHLHRHDGETALKVARDWLATHSRDGQLGRDEGDDDRGNEKAETTAADDAWRSTYVETLWGCAGPIGGTSAEAYLKSRSLWPLPDLVDGMLRWAPNARGDEGALVVAATAAGKVSLSSGPTSHRTARSPRRSRRARYSVVPMTG